jgi:alkylated DNA repair dioxygenase AlkB
MGKRRREDEEEIVRALSDSPWEVMQRQAGEESGVRRRLCAHCGWRDAARGNFCGEYCEVAHELTEE